MTGVYCIARFSTDSIFYRAQIMNVDAKVCMAEVRWVVSEVDSEDGWEEGCESR